METANVKQVLSKPAELRSWASQIAHELGKSWKRTIAILLGIALLILAGALWEARVSERNEVAADSFYDLLQAMPEAQNRMSPEVTPAKDWADWVSRTDGFMKTHGGSSLAPTMSLYRGRALLETGKPEEALAAFRQAERKLSKPYLYFALEGEGNALTELKKWDEATAVWSRLSKAEDNPLRAQHLWNLGLTQESAGKPQQALETYETFEKEQQNSPLLERARERIGSLRLAKSK